MRKKTGLILLIIMILTVSAFGSVFADGDADMDIKLDSVKQRNIDNKSDLDISQYDFFSSENRTEMEKIEALYEKNRSLLLNGLFNAGLIKPETDETSRKINELSMFDDSIEYTLGNYDETSQVDYKNILLVVVFVVLGVASYFAAVQYTKFKRRRKNVH